MNWSSEKTIESVADVTLTNLVEIFVRENFDESPKLVLSKIFAK